MDYVTISSTLTVLILVIFIGIVLWAYSKKAKPGFDEAANLVFDDEQTQKDATQEKRES